MTKAEAKRTRDWGSFVHESPKTEDLMLAALVERFLAVGPEGDPAQPESDGEDQVGAYIARGPVILGALEACASLAPDSAEWAAQGANARRAREFATSLLTSFTGGEAAAVQAYIESNRRGDRGTMDAFERRVAPKFLAAVRTTLAMGALRLGVAPTGSPSMHGTDATPCPVPAARFSLGHAIGNLMSLRRSGTKPTAEGHYKQGHIDGLLALVASDVEHLMGRTVSEILEQVAYALGGDVDPGAALKSVNKTDPAEVRARCGRVLSMLEDAHRGRWRPYVMSAIDFHINDVKSGLA